MIPPRISPRSKTLVHQVWVCALALACILLAQPQPVQAEAGRVTAVKLIAPEEVKSVLEKYLPRPEKLLTDESERAIYMRSVQREITDLLTTEGYFSGKAMMRPASTAGELEIEVTPGPRTLVTDVNIEVRGELALADAPHKARVNRLLSAWPLQVGSPFRALAWSDSKAAILAHLVSEDYAAAKIVESSAEVDGALASARIHIVVDSGPRFIFGALEVSGLDRYEEKLISRYSTFTAGQPYRRDTLLSFQAQLQNLPQFSSVIVTIDTTPAASPEAVARGFVTAAVKVQVVEALSRKIALGLGYSTNNGVRNEVSYESYNFWDQAWTLKSAAVIEQNRQTLSASVEAPPNPHGYYLTWTGSGERTEIQGLETRTNKFGVTRSRTRFDIETGVGPYWQQEQQIPEGGVRETAQALVLDWYWTRRKVDNPMLPMSGTLTQVRIGASDKTLLSDQTFVRSYVREQVWIPVGSHDSLSFRIEGGYTAASSSKGIPQDYLFRVGGTQTVRGFAYQSLGVRDGDAVVGGRVMATGSAEYTHWFGNWGAALFADSGGVADFPSDLYMSTGYGAGARWRSPIGPLALDLAHGEGEPGNRLHFSIAVAF